MTLPRSLRDVPTRDQATALLKIESGSRKSYYHPINTLLSLHNRGWITLSEAVRGMNGVPSYQIASLTEEGQRILRERVTA